MLFLWPQRNYVKPFSKAAFGAGTLLEVIGHMVVTGISASFLPACSSTFWVDHRIQPREFIWYFFSMNPYGLSSTPCGILKVMICDDSLWIHENPWESIWEIQRTKRIKITHWKRFRTPTERHEWRIQAVQVQEHRYKHHDVIDKGSFQTHNLDVNQM